MDEKDQHQGALKMQIRQLVSLECLFLNLSLVALIPQDKQSVIEVMEDIEELKECYNNLGIDTVKSSSKKAKRTSEDNTARIEAQGVLIDFLTSLLTKPQSFLREVANACFKQFCVECLDEEGIARLMGIVATPNAEADGFMQAGAQADNDSDVEEASESGSDAQDDSDSESDDL